MANKQGYRITMSKTKYQDWIGNVLVLSYTMEHFCECNPELCSLWSKIQRNRNSEWELNMVLVFSNSIQFSSVQLLSRVRLFVTPWIAASQASLSITNSRGVHTNSRSLSWWCHPAISSSVIPFSSCPQSLPASESFPMSQLFAWGGQSTGASASASFLPKKSQGWSPSEWIGWISLQSKGL